MTRPALRVRRDHLGICRRSVGPARRRSPRRRRLVAQGRQPEIQQALAASRRHLRLRLRMHGESADLRQRYALPSNITVLTPLPRRQLHHGVTHSLKTSIGPVPRGRPQNPELLCGYRMSMTWSVPDIATRLKRYRKPSSSTRISSRASAATWPDCGSNLNSELGRRSPHWRAPWKRSAKRNSSAPTPCAIPLPSPWSS